MLRSSKLALSEEIGLFWFEDALDLQFREFWSDFRRCSPPKGSKKLRIWLRIVIRRPSKAFEDLRRPWDAKLDVFKVLLEGLWGSFWSPNSPETQKNHDLKTHVLEDVFSETFFNDFERFSDI